MQTERQEQGMVGEDEVFQIEHNYRTKMKVARSRLIRQLRRDEAQPNGRKISKRIRKYQPVYAFNHYHPDQPWDILAIQSLHPPEEAQDGSCEESIQVEKGLPYSESTAQFKEETMSRQTICEPKPCTPSIFQQAFTNFDWVRQQ